MWEPAVVDLPRSDVDPGGLLEYSVVFTDRSLNHMSKRFVAVMQDIVEVLCTTYHAETVAVVPGTPDGGVRHHPEDQYVGVRPAQSCTARDYDRAQSRRLRGRPSGRAAGARAART
jgi:hypothetical protein